jgi:predicted RNase H-like HicB family nuclease
MQYNHIQMELPVIIIREAEQFVAYSPVLELCTSGDSIESAKKNFEEMVDIFFDEIIEAGTLAEVLSDLGWEKENHNWMPPEIIAQPTQSIRLKLPQ